MATLLDTGLFESLDVIFTWLFVFLVVFGVLEITNIFKNKSIHALLAFVIAILTGFSSITISIVEVMLPWFLLIAFFVFFVMLITSFMGFGGKDLVNALGGSGAVWWILVLGFIIVAATLSQVFGQDLLDAGENAGEVEDNVVTTLTNPKVLGFFLILLIGAFTIIFMASGGKAI